jgi:hypothetical protein
MTSTDGRTTVQQSSTVQAPDAVSVGGTTFTAAVVDSVLHLSGDVNGTISARTSVETSRMLPLRTHTVTDVMYGAVHIVSDITADATSVTPT